MPWQNLCLLVLHRHRSCNNKYNQYEQEWQKSHLEGPQGVASYDYVRIDGSVVLTKLADSLLGVVYYPA